jgi:hypothetical protein
MSLFVTLILLVLYFIVLVCLTAVCGANSRADQRISPPPDPKPSDRREPRAGYDYDELL